jgi:predicted AAA+ superfamily ATPase
MWYRIWLFNTHWEYRIMDQKYVPRAIDAQILAFIQDRTEHKQVLLVEGARQVGKTMLVQSSLEVSGKRVVAVNLERDALLCSAIDRCDEFKEFAEVLRDRTGFAGDSDCVLFVDEAQESTRLGRFVRFMKEEWKRATVILSGSTLQRLFRPEVRYPVGRVRTMVLRPFSFTEFLRASGDGHLADEIASGDLRLSPQRHEHILSLYDRFLETGGLPAVVNARSAGEDDLSVRAQIIAGYHRDFLRIFGEDTIEIVDACLRSVANFVGGVSKNTSVVPSPGTRMNERINGIFARLESWHLLLRSEQRGPSDATSHAYLPKRYLFDTGVLRHLRESAVPSIGILRSLTAIARLPLGGILENQAAIELAKLTETLAGWKRSSAGGEIDFVTKVGGRTLPVECKASLSVNARHLKGIASYLRDYGEKVGVVVSFAPFSTMTLDGGRRVIVLPAYFLERMADAVAMAGRRPSS